MAEAHLDHPGEIHWFKGEGPAPVIGPCPHAGCQHFGQGVIAWGPTLDRYELVECGIADDAHGCAARCRAWVDGHGRVTTAWLQVEPASTHDPSDRGQTADALVALGQDSTTGTIPTEEPR